MSVFQWEFVSGWYALCGLPNVRASVMPQRPLVRGRRVDKWLLRMSFYIEQTEDAKAYRNSYKTREKVIQAAEEIILRYKLEGKI